MDIQKYFSDWADVPLEDIQEGYSSEYIEMLEDFQKKVQKETYEGLLKAMENRKEHLETMLKDKPDHYGLNAKVLEIQSSMGLIHTKLIKLALS